MSTADLEWAQDQLDLLCRKVGMVRRQALPPFDKAASPPARAALWSSSYALLLLWPIESSESQAIEHGASEGEGWLDAALSELEAQRPERPLDGYLVIALPNPPEDRATEDIRRLELSSRICRKHLIWPSPNETIAAGEDPWCRVADITVLGLPDAVTSAGDELYWPSMDSESEALWNDLLAKGAPATAQQDEDWSGLQGKDL